jgi:hypothetical protein
VATALAVTSYGRNVRKEATTRWLKAARQPQGILVGVTLAGLYAGFYYLSHRHNSEALRQVFGWLWTLPVAAGWLVALWLWYWGHVPADFAKSQDEKISALSKINEDLRERLTPKLEIMVGMAGEFERAESVLTSPMPMLADEHLETIPLVRYLKIANVSDAHLTKVTCQVRDADPPSLPGTLPVRLQWQGDHDDERDIPARSHDYVLLVRYAMVKDSRRLNAQSRIDSPVKHVIGREVILTLEAWADNALAPARTRIRVVPNVTSLAHPYLIEEMTGSAPS